MRNSKGQFVKSSVPKVPKAKKVPKVCSNCTWQPGIKAEGQGTGLVDEYTRCPDCGGTGKI
jgi:DnaJ-class molecular chaperone